MKLSVPPSDAAALKCLVAASAGKVAVEVVPAGKAEVNPKPYTIRRAPTTGCRSAGVRPIRRHFISFHTRTPLARRAAPIGGPSWFFFTSWHFLSASFVVSTRSRVR